MSSTSNTVFRAQDFSYTYAQAQHPCLNKITFTIEEGTTTLITGLSGCGKSTLMKCMCNIIDDICEGEHEGLLELYGKDIFTLSNFEVAKKVGVVFQNPRSQFFTDSTTSELIFAQENYGYSSEEIEESLTYVESLFPIEPLLDRELHTLSMGERQLLALACAQTLGQKILLFDEPSANLDWGHAMALGQIIRKLNGKGITCIVCDHRHFYLEDAISKVLYLEDGKMEEFPSLSAWIESGKLVRGKEGRADAQNTCRTESTLTCECECECECEQGYSACTKDKVLDVRNLSFKHILKDVNLTLHAGEIMCLIGINGSGKTTLARLMSGLEKQDAGDIEVESVFYVAQDADYQLFGSSVEQEFHIGSSQVSDDRIEHALKALELDQNKNRHPFSLSGGEKQRLQIALAMTSEAELIILDEPTSGLDAKRMQLVAHSLKELAETSGILVITHDLDFIQHVATHIASLWDGTIEEVFPYRDEGVNKTRELFKRMELTYVES